MNLQQLIYKIQRRLKLYVWHLLCVIKGTSIHSFRLTDGSQFDYPFKSEVGRCLFIGAFETAETEFIRQKIKVGDIFLDIGANAGFYTVIVSKIVGSSGHVYAFEPGERELNLLRRNIANNNLSNVTIVERAVSNEKSTVRFAISHDGAMNSLSETNHPSQVVQEWKMVEATTIDDFIKDFNVTDIDFIKIDVEGAEHLVFEGAKQFLSIDKSRFPTILFESSDLTASGFGYSVSDFLQKLDSLGLRICVLDEGSNPVDIIEYSKQEKIGNTIYNFIATMK